jgi:spectinomycin phosphotransferase
MWMLAAGNHDAVDIYARESGTTLDPAALDFFRLTWSLKDVAEYLNVLRLPHQENDDTMRQARALTNVAAIREEWAALLD